MDKTKNKCAVLLVALSISPCVVAQERVAVTHTEKIEVTGSNIPRVDAEGALPLQIITREELARGGVQTVQDVIDRISANQSFGAWNEAKGVGNTEFGNTSASLRGLGADRTLVLLNGRRLSPYALSGGAHIDLSGIPATAIERVEVLKDGASAVYGTDAIGGVINFITRRDYKGVEAAASYYKTEHGGGDNWRASFTAGYGSLDVDRFNAFITFDYLKQDVLRAIARESTRTAYRPDLAMDQTVMNSFPANVQQAGLTGSFNPTVPPTGALPSSCLPPFSFPTVINPRTCQFDYVPLIDSIPESDKTNIIGRLTYALASEHQAFAEASFYRGHVTQRIAPTPISRAATGGQPVLLPPSSPFYPSDFIASIGGDPARPIALQYRLVELGPRVVDVTVDEVRGVAGMKGTMAEWDYEGAVSYVRNRQVPYHVSGEVSRAAFLPLINSGAVNPFGYNTEDVLSQLGAMQITGKDSDNRASNFGGDFKMTRELGATAAGPVGVAIGAEARRESLEMVNSEMLYTGDILGGPGPLPSLTESSRKVASLYAEVNVPVTASLELNLAVRTDHYSDFGTTTNPKLSMRWRAAPQAIIRAAYGSGFRAPTLFDLFQPNYNFDLVSPVEDPVRCPVTHAPQDCEGEVLIRGGGNPQLQPEKSRQLNAGIVWEPLRQFSMTLDYYRVEVRNLNAFVGFFDLLDTYHVRQASDAQYPGLPGPYAYLANYKFNVGTLRTSGSDVDLRWRAPSSSWGQLTLSLTGTYVIDYEIDGAFTDAPEGAGRRGRNDGAVSRWRHYAMIDWNRGPWGATLAQNFQNGYSEIDLATCADPSGPQIRDNCPGDRRVGSYSIWDLQARYRGVRNLSLALGVRNLFDRAPPLTNQGGTFQVGIDPTYGDPRGRVWYAAVRYAFR